MLKENQKRKTNMAMACRWHKKAVRAVMWAALSVAAQAGPLDLNVVYPQNDQFLPAVDSTFIFGSVRPGADLTVNGHPVEVHKEGGWLAFVPVSPGLFALSVRAEKGDRIDTLTVPVNLPPLPSYSFDSLYIVPGSMRPSQPLWVRPGDRMEIAFSSLPYCNAFCTVEPIGDTIPMREIPPRSYYGGANVFEKDSLLPGRVADSLLIRGIYEGSYVVPATEPDSLRLIYHVYPPSIEQMAWLIQYALRDSLSLSLHSLAALPPILAETSAVAIRVLDPKALPVAELTDSLTIIRTGPGRGYLCIHQPAGIRAEAAGKSPPWLKLRLADNQYGWVPDTSAALLPEGTVAPHSYIRRVTTVNNDDYVSVIVSTSARHPFRVVENIRDRTITIYLYGADSDTDWIRYDNSDDLIDHIVWFQDEPGVYGLRLFLTEDRFWGYDGYYIGHEFHFDVKKHPGRSLDISDFRFVIDPGHSPDPGAVGPTGLTEREVNLAIALRLQKKLEGEGAEAILTRADDSPLGLYDRPEIAVRKRADIFISIHNNALPDGTNPFVNNGVSTYYYHPHSAPLARAVQDALARTLGLNDFGIYYGNLAVNRPTQYPAILVECAFMMIPEQETRLKTVKFRKKTAECIVEGIKDFLRGRALTEWDLQQMESYGRNR